MEFADKPSCAETRDIPGDIGQCYGCWCPGSLRRQDNNSHNIDHAIINPFLFERNNFNYIYMYLGCTISVSKNGKKYIHAYMFLRNNSSCKKVNHCCFIGSTPVEIWTWTLPFSHIGLPIRSSITVTSLRGWPSSLPQPWIRLRSNRCFFAQESITS